MRIRTATKANKTGAAKVNKADNVVPIGAARLTHDTPKTRIADVYGVSARTIDRWLNRGDWKPGMPPPTRIGRLKILESNQQVPTSAELVAKSSPTRADLVGSRGDRLDVWSALALGVAIGLAGVAAYFSVTGMTRIFPGATIAIIAMASMMEGGKLIGAAWLSRQWRATNWLLRVILVVLLAILALINATGVFGQLSAAHIDPHVETVAATDELAAANQAGIEVKQNMIADLNSRIAQIDAAIEEDTKRGRATAAMALSQGQQLNRAQLIADRLRSEGELNVLKAQQARIAGAQSRASADIGVLEYAAALLGIDRERMMQWLILAMVLTCDPLSLALVVATGAHNRPRTDARTRTLPPQAKPA
jgi:hypothetical protein